MSDDWKFRTERLILAQKTTNYDEQQAILKAHDLSQLKRLSVQVRHIRKDWDSIEPEIRKHFEGIGN